VAFPAINPAVTVAELNIAVIISGGCDKAEPGVGRVVILESCPS
jgi:hypothetical protein